MIGPVGGWVDGMVICIAEKENVEPGLGVLRTDEIYIYIYRERGLTNQEEINIINWHGCEVRYIYIYI